MGPKVGDPRPETRDPIHRWDMGSETINPKDGARDQDLIHLFYMGPKTRDPGQ